MSAKSRGVSGSTLAFLNALSENDIIFVSVGLFFKNKPSTFKNWHFQNVLALSSP